MRLKGNPPFAYICSRQNTGKPSQEKVVPHDDVLVNYDAFLHTMAYKRTQRLPSASLVFFAFFSTSTFSMLIQGIK